MKSANVCMDGIAVPVMLLDRDQRITSANKAAHETFPYLVHGDDLHSLGHLDQEAGEQLRSAAENSHSASFSIVTNETFQREFLVFVGTAVTSPDTAQPTLILTFADQTPLRDAKSMRSDFVANVSHEIRSPLTAISGFVETLQGDARNDAEARKLFLSLMEKEVVRMTNLVTDLLSLSKVEAKERRAPRRAVDPAQVLHQAIESVTALARARDKHISTKIPTDLPGILGKPDDLARAFINLLENAINYSREGAQITVIARFCSHETPLSREAICIAIRDQGDGIPASEIPRLTERFYRVDKSRSRDVGGTGLGLAIVKHILVRHRGKLVIDSKLGQGTTAHVYLPVAPSKKATTVT